MMLTMIGFALLLFPVVLLGFVVLMGRVEEPLSQMSVEREIEHFLDDANQAELNTFVSEGPDPALQEFQARSRRFRLRRGWRRASG
jgi:hypothetical protein